MKSVVIEGKRYVMREIVKLYNEQRAQERKAKQPTLFPLVEDSRPPTQSSAAGRYTEPLLF
jgi:hypothetical protein